MLISTETLPNAATLIHESLFLENSDINLSMSVSIKHLDIFHLESTPPRHIPLAVSDHFDILDEYNTLKILAIVLYSNTIIIA